MMSWVDLVVVVGCLLNKKDKDLKVIRDRTNTVTYCGAVGCNVFLPKDKANKHTRFWLTERSLRLQISILAPPSIQN